MKQPTKNILTKFNNRWLTLALIGLILLFSLGLRVYRLDQIPPAISWDEASVGYNAYAIANWGRDEYGKFLPWTFKSFGDDKSPVHVYFTALSVKIFGLSDWSIRLAPAVFGMFNVGMLYLVVNQLFKRRWLAIIAAVMLAISPYSLQFSRFNHEANFALFFWLTGLWLWLKGVKDDPFWLPFSVFSMGLSLLSYHSSKVVVPLMLGVLIVLYAKELWRIKVYAGISLVIVLLFAGLYRWQPDLLGTARLEQASIPVEEIHKLSIYQQTQNEFLARVQMWWQRYMVYYSPEYLFVTGDKIERHSTGAVGEFFKVDALLFMIGALWLAARRSREALVLVAWVLIAPLPAAVAGGLTETGHAARALFTMGSWTTLAAAGLYGAIVWLRKKPIQIVAVLLVVMIYAGQFYNYVQDYYLKYPVRSAGEWQYGMKQVVDYVKAHPEYNLIYMTDIRSQPYAFFLTYLQYPLPDYLREVEYNPTNQRPHNNVYSFNKYHFGDWEQIQSMPRQGVLYVVEPAVYDGLAHKKDFKVVELVKYPNGNSAFYLVAGEQ